MVVAQKRSGSGEGLAGRGMIVGLRDGRHLRAARVLAGLTQAELAEIAGLHPKSIAYWERQPAIGIVEGTGAIPSILSALAKFGVSAALGSEMETAMLAQGSNNWHPRTISRERRLGRR